MRNKKVGHMEEELEQKALAIMQDFVGFTDGVRYLTLLHRTKDGGHNKEHKRRGGFFVAHDQDEYRDALVRLLTLQAVSSKPYRLYASVNARNVQKAERAFKMDMLMCDFADETNKAAFWKMLPSKWSAALMQPGSRVGNAFVLDVDGEGDVTAPVLKWLASQGIEALKQYKTPNGWHLITPPFNPTEMPEGLCDVKKDALILLNA